MAQAEKRKGSAAVAEVAERTMEQLSGRPVVLGADRGDPRLVHVGKLSIDQWLAIARLAFKVAMGMGAEERAELAEASKAKDNNSIAAMLTVLLDKKTILGLIGILGQVEEKWLERNFSMAEVTELLEAVDEQEDLRRVIAPFQRIAERWRTSPAPGAKT